MRFFFKKQIHFLADRVSEGNFSVFLPFSIRQKISGDNQSVKMRYHVILLILLTTLFVHSWTFFERHLFKNVISPIALIATGLFFDKLFAASNEAQPPAGTNNQNSAAPSEGGNNPNTAATAEGSTNQDAANSKEKKQENESFDPLGLTESRIKILLSLSEREKEIKAREELLVTKENMLKAVEAQVQKKTTELSELKTVIESLSKNYNEEVNKNIKNLISIYEAMKPQAAAKFFNELPLDVLTNLVRSMNSKKISAIFTFMNVEKVKAVTDRLALMPKVPEKKDDI